MTSGRLATSGRRCETKRGTPYSIVRSPLEDFPTIRRTSEENGDKEAKNLNLYRF